MNEQLTASPTTGRWLDRLITTLAAWLIAFVIVWILLAIVGEKLASWPIVLEALVFTGVLVPLMGNVVMPLVSKLRTHQAMDTTSIQLRPIGQVQSPLTHRAASPKQGDEGSPKACLIFTPGVTAGLDNLIPGTDIIVLTWLDRARRDVLRAHPRHPANPEQGVFSTRSPDRPNPIGLHRVHITAIADTKIFVRNLEALNGTPILDIKPVLDRDIEK